MQIFPDFSWKNYCSHASILSNKRLLCQKDAAFMPLLSDFTWKDQLSHSLFLSKKRALCQKQTGLMPTLSDFHGKITILSEMVHSLKNTALKAILGQNNSILLKNKVLSGHFFESFMKIPLLSCQYFVKKTLILSKL